MSSCFLDPVSKMTCPSLALSSLPPCLHSTRLQHWSPMAGKLLCLSIHNAPKAFKFPIIHPSLNSRQCTWFSRPPSPASEQAATCPHLPEDCLHHFELNTGGTLKVPWLFSSAKTRFFFFFFSSDPIIWCRTQTSYYCFTVSEMVELQVFSEMEMFGLRNICVS